MNDATLEGFRSIANSMRPPVPHDWEWVGEYISQRMFGITEERAKAYAAKYGGAARKSPERHDNYERWVRL